MKPTEVIAAAGSNAPSIEQGPQSQAGFLRSWRRRIAAPFDGTADTEILSALLLLAFTAVAICCANSPWADGYASVWSTGVDVRVGASHFGLTLRALVNDGLMSLFFFSVGLEVKHELTIGELTDRSRALVPVAAAVAGLILPACLFLVVNRDGALAHAWGVVISTDTAFVVGALALVRPTYLARLRVFLMTLAVVDDIGALAAIALFYTDGVQWKPLLVAVGLCAAVAAVRYLRIGTGPAYAALAVLMWLALHAAHIHPTLTGVLVALLIPVFPPRRAEVERTLELTRAFRQSPNPSHARAAVQGLRDSISINERLQASFAPYVDFLVLPIFALANAGVRLSGSTLEAAATSPLTWGIVAGLVVGKLAGVSGVTALLCGAGIGKMAPGLTGGRLVGGAALSGIGFTISLFIVDIAIADPALQDQARVGVLAASLLALGFGWVILKVADYLSPAAAIGATLIRSVDPTRDHIRGDPNAPLTLVEYGDFECSFCSRATGSIDEVRAHFGSELRHVWRHLTLTRVHPRAFDAALASEAAALQGRFFDMGRMLFTHHHALQVADLVNYARMLALDVQRFEADMHSAQVINRVKDDVLDAEVMDLHAVPTFFIGNARHQGPYDAASLIRALEASRPPSLGTGPCGPTDHAAAPPCVRCQEGRSCAD